MLRPTRGPITSDHSVAGWRLLSGFLHRPAVLHGRLGCTPGFTPLRRPRLPSTGLEPWRTAGFLRLHSTPDELQTDSEPRQTARLAFQRALLWRTGVSLISHLQPFTPRWPRPCCHFDPISSRSADVRGRCRNHPYHADVVEIIGSRPNEGTPASVGGDVVH